MIKFADQTGTKNSTTYYMTRFVRGNWLDSLLFCQKFNMDMLTLESEKEYDNFQTILKNNTSILDGMIYVGAVELEPYKMGPNAPWMWVKSGQQVNTTNKWNVGKPDNTGVGQSCLGLYKGSGYRYDDFFCNTPSSHVKIVCKKSRMVWTYYNFV